MSIQRLSARNLRRLGRLTGLTVVYGYANGGYHHFFITDDHQHGWFDLKTNEWGIESPFEGPHVHPICSQIEAALTRKARP
jgi:hypothetical protein